MADLTDMPHFHAPPRFDGAPHCVLCSTTALTAGHEWCPAAQCVVCQECCSRLMQGDMNRLVSIVANTGKSLTPEMLFESCSSCERAARRLSEEILRRDDVDGHPC